MWGGGRGRGKREWSVSPRHEARASEDNKGGWQGAGKRSPGRGMGRGGE